MGVHTLASGDLKGPPRDEVPVDVSWDGTAVQLEDSEWSGEVSWAQLQNPVLATLSVVFPVRALDRSNEGLEGFVL